MAHLKKLADKLKVPQPAVKRVIQFGDRNDKFLKGPTTKVSHLSRKVAKFVIPSLKLTAARFELGSLSANQLGFSESVFVVSNHLVENQWLNYEKSDYSAFVNPELVKVGGAQLDGLEECISTRKIKATVTRFDEIKLSFLDESGEYIEKEFSGFPARVIQHELDHLWGFTILNLSVSYGELLFPTEVQANKYQFIKQQFSMQKPTQVDTALAEREYFVRASINSVVEDEFLHKLRSLLTKTTNKFDEEVN